MHRCLSLLGIRNPHFLKCLRLNCENRGANDDLVIIIIRLVGQSFLHLNVRIRRRLHFCNDVVHRSHWDKFHRRWAPSRCHWDRDDKGFFLILDSRSRSSDWSDEELRRETRSIRSFLLLPGLDPRAFLCGRPDWSCSRSSHLCLHRARELPRNRGCLVEGRDSSHGYAPPRGDWDWNWTAVAQTQRRLHQHGAIQSWVRKQLTRLRRLE
mmetsp:Transcript_47429/g.76874  ORF Transcript_47429/g.76874 Transcript_47429/m.76874 type:complete len:210 (+) Transcript_47429:296-925(+)